MMGSRQQGVEAWLSALGLQEYLRNFQNFKGIEDLLYLTETSLRDLGVKNGSHRARMVSSLVVLRDKLGKKTVPGGMVRPIGPNLNAATPSSPGYCMPPPLLFNHGDYAMVQAPYQPLRPYSPCPLSPLTGSQSGDGQELYRYVWYHGGITRQSAEQLVTKNGEFLIRDSTSQPGDYVLTCCWKGAKLHFVVNRQHVFLETGETKLQYQFEDILFDRVAELIHHYVAEKKAISEMSGAVISKPVSRIAGFDPYDVIKQGGYGYSPSRGFLVVPGPHSTGHTPRVSPRPSPLVSPNTTPSHSPPSGRRIVHRRTGSQPLLSLSEDSESPRSSPEMHKPSSSAADVTSPTPAEPISGEPSGGNKAKSTTRCLTVSPLLTARKKSGNLNGADPKPSLPTKSGKYVDPLDKSAPPKPSRIPTIKRKERPVIQIRNKALYEDDGKDYSDYDQVKAWTESKSSAQENGSILSKDGETSLLLLQAANYETPILQEVCNDNENGATVKKSGVIVPGKCVDGEEESAYDNNFRHAGIVQEVGNYDVPKQIDLKVLEKTKRRGLFSETTVESISGINSGMNLGLLSLPTITLPKLDLATCYNLTSFTSSVLPPDNKPLEGGALVTIKTFLQESSPKVLAQHITKVDLETLKVIGQLDLGLGVTSGLELITLPQGHHMRQDILERYHCMKLFVAVMVLTCVKYPERARMMSQWIQVAGELRAATGDLFGFSAIMEAFRMPQISRLRNTWLSLKHNHGNSAILYENKLTGSLRGMDEGGSTLPLQNVTIPHIMPLVELMERGTNDLEIMTEWEQTNSDYGIDILLAHMDTARIVTEQCGLYRVTAEGLLNKFQPDRDMMDMFQTEMHLKLLWGSKGAGANQQERYNKFGQILTVLSERAEPSQLQVDQETSV